MHLSSHVTIALYAASTASPQLAYKLISKMIPRAATNCPTAWAFNWVSCRLPAHRLNRISMMRCRLCVTTFISWLSKWQRNVLSTERCFEIPSRNCIQFVEQIIQYSSGKLHMIYPQQNYYCVESWWGWTCEGVVEEDCWPSYTYSVHSVSWSCIATTWC